MEDFMGISKIAKKYLFFGIFFGACAIAFSLLYYFNVIKNLDLFLAVIYVIYFTGVALFFNGGYCREKGNVNAKRINYIISFLCVAGATALLIYGLVIGKVSLFY